MCQFTRGEGEVYPNQTSRDAHCAQTTDLIGRGDLEQQVVYVLRIVKSRAVPRNLLKLHV